MGYYPNTTISFPAILQRSVRYHYATLKNTMLMIFFFVIVKDAYIYFGGMPTSKVGYWFVVFVMGVGMIYLWACILYAAHLTLRRSELPINNVYKIIYPKIFSIFLTALGYVIIAIVVFYFAKFTLFIAGKLGNYQPSALSYGMVVFAGIPLMYIYVVSLLAFPLAVIEEISPIKAFAVSNLLSWRHWIRMFVVYIIMLLMFFLVSPDTLHSHLLRGYHAVALYDLVLLSVLLPLLANLLLLTLHDLQIREDRNVVS